MAENNNPADTVAVTVAEEKNTATKEDEENTVTKDEANGMKRVAFPLMLFSFILSLPILVSVFWLLSIRQLDCEDLLKLPKLQDRIVIVLIIVFLVSNVVVFLRARMPMPGLILVMVPLIMMVTVGLALMGVYKMESSTIPGSPVWLKMKVHDNNYWNDIKSCIYRTRTCQDLVSKSYFLQAYDFTTTKLSPIESGCCKPPPICDMEYVNATFWRKGDVAIDSSNPYDSDCDLWENEENTLCYDCQACKEGFLRTLHSKWLKIGIFLTVMALLLILSHLLLFVLNMWERHRG
ncbi:hypothetical protein F0562_009233 [Nyssa sinensis]|uniref:Tetraspanin n=1 Tax=Nyssa sinensis TaxID=561372 RepID=A0A5J4ZWX4_9ASTE|nr:hypothetical protein F0562_009233 [Nyssa sinensis]